MSIRNQHAKRTSAVMGFLLAMSGIINHGIFEILQGNTRTDGLFIEAIGPSHRFWIHGTEGAITLVPNFLITGISVLLIGIMIIAWSFKFIHHEHGPTIFLVLMIALTLVGGGLGHVVFFIPVWAYSTRINKPLIWYNQVLSAKAQRFLKQLWLPALSLTSLSWLVVMELGIFGYFPGQTNPDTILNITFGFVLLSVLLANLTYWGAFAHDLDRAAQTISTDGNQRQVPAL